MKSIYPKQIFVTGTDTGVGKTIIAAILTAGLNAHYWKPIQCGLEDKTDTEVVRELTGLSEDFFYQETYRLAAPLSPHASASLEKITIELAEMNLPVQVNRSRVVVEGAGGIMVPLNEKEYMLDLMKQLDLPVLVVARSGLGTINHTLLSLQALNFKGVTVFGVVLNGPKNQKNKEAIEQYGKVDVLAEIEPIEDIEVMDCRRIFAEKFKKFNCTPG